MLLTRILYRFVILDPRNLNCPFVIISFSHCELFSYCLLLNINNTDFPFSFRIRVLFSPCGPTGRHCSSIVCFDAPFVYLKYVHRMIVQYPLQWKILFGLLFFMSSKLEQDYLTQLLI